MTSKKYAKTFNLIFAGNKVFEKFQAQEGVLNPPLRTPLIMMSKSVGATVTASTLRLQNRT